MENIKEEDQYLIPGFTLKQTISLQTLITASITEALEQRLGPANGFIQTQAPISGMQASTTAHEDNSGAGVANSTTAQIPPTAKNFKGEEEIKVKETSDERMTTSDISSLDQATKKALEKRKADKIDEPPAPAAKKSRSKSKTPTQSSKDNSLPNRLPNDRTIVPQFYSDAYHRLPANAALGRAHVVDIERYFSTEGSRPLKMADVIATILFRHQIKVLDAFLNVPRHLDFSFTRREQADSHHLDFSIERRNFTVQVSLDNFSLQRTPSNG